MLGLVSLEKEGSVNAAHYQEQALQIGREIKDRYLEAMALSNLAYAMGVSQSDYFTALGYFEQAYSIACELGNVKGQAITLLNMGWLNGMLGNYPAAIDYYKQALPVLQRTRDRSQEINVCVNLSAAASGQGNAQDALKWGTRALAFSMELADRAGSAWSYFYLGYAQLLAGQLDEAARSFLQSIEIRSQISTPVLVAEARAGLLDVYLKMDDRDAARIYGHRQNIRRRGRAVSHLLDGISGFTGNKRPARRNCPAKCSSFVEHAGL
jgi:tetratricopeptide (TPR) repeat protein